MKVHVVREAFGLDGVDYPRGAELRDRSIIGRAKEQFPGHLRATSEDAPPQAAPKVSTGDKLAS